MCFNTIFFDLDDTLYPSTTGLWDALRIRIDRYMIDRMNLSEEVVPDLRKELFIKHGTTMRGLEAVYNIDEQDFLAFVHDVPIEDYLQPDPALRAVLKGFHQRKIIFTNADINHANRVIGALDLGGCFDQIIDICDINPFCKPQPEAFEKALWIAEIREPSTCVMIDDSLRNLETAKQTGMFTVQIGQENCPAGVDASIHSLHELPRIIPNTGGKSKIFT
jgi:pyrimidine 5'-nucleotidase